MTRRKLEGRVGGLAFLVVLAILVPHRVETAKKFSEWSVPVNLGPVVNSAFEEFLPEISKDGLSLYFASNRPGPFGGEDSLGLAARHAGRRLGRTPESGT